MLSVESMYEVCLKYVKFSKYVQNNHK